ncbi:hypothetical protein [Mycobacterium kubicae]|uniref:hypothetical protein n=1 Tax=Mycobacterium kubicae TaxID=120959 RepID=UPI0013D2ADA7|nr:hypothetical protein [Mycobacterium kubicae]
MKLVSVQGVHRRRWRREPPAAASWPDLVQRQFRAEGPDRLWVTDIERREALFNRTEVRPPSPSHRSGPVEAGGSLI